MFFDRDMMREYGDYAERVQGLAPQNFVIPQIIEKTARGERMYDLFSRLMEDRIIIIGGVVTDFLANVVVGQLLFLQKENKNLDVSLYINSPGGHVTAGLAIYDTMQFVACDVSTCCIGMAASMGAVLLGGGEKGKRYSLPSSRIMIHQPWGGIGGTAEDIKRQADEVLAQKRLLIDILAKHTESTAEKIESEINRDYFMSPQQAKEYKLIDDVISTLKKKKTT